ncbi:phosphoribosyltransferase family protein [Streptomyces massasporeus]|uniref:phosphoribosyltransferase family protein n=1 Tax=Streptomyces massasporeus TaxID=67324 RepID=UPI0033F5807C
MPESSEDVLDGLVFRAASDRTARIMSWSAVQRDINLLAAAIRESAIMPTALIGIFQGGWLVAQCLADHFSEGPVLGALACPDSRGEVRVELLQTRDGLLTAAVPETGSTVLLVDEVVDSGRTARFYLDRLRRDFGLRPYLACLAANADADPAPEFAAQRMDALPALVLPWRVLRDFEQTAACLLRAEPLTTHEIDERLREFGYDIPPEVLDARLHALAAKGRVSLSPDGEWSRGSG